MDPVTAWNIAKTTADITSKLYEFGKTLKDRKLKEQIDSILDELRELKQSASRLEDENRELREKLRFNRENYDFRTPFYYEKARPEMALCPKCFSKEIASPMGEQGQMCDANSRRCLVCENAVEVNPNVRRQPRNPTY